MSNQSAIIKAIENHPLNRGLTGAEWFSYADNVTIVRGEDIALFDAKGDGIFEELAVMLKSRGRAAIDFVKEAFRRMFEEHDAETIFAMIPDFRRDVKLLARWAGMKFVGKRMTQHGLCELFVLSKDMHK